MNSDINFVSPFKRFCITIGNLPTSYLESMSYYESLTYLVNYLANNVIPALNNNGEVVKEVQEKLVELQKYVDDYFENLDVQEEIDNKLDQMALDGQLSTIILDYLQMSGIMIYDTLADMKETEHVIEGSYLMRAGELSYQDGKRALYRVRLLDVSDVVDEDELVSLTNFPTLVAEKLIDERLDDIESSITNIESNIGDLSSLTTTAQDSIVNAINEVNANTGDITNLTTSDKDSTVDAINEVNASVGDLTDLDTTDKSNLVEAINEVNELRKFDFSVHYQAYRSSSDSDTAQITLGKFYPSTHSFTTTSSNISNVYCNINGSTNADGSAGKIYGPVRMTTNYSMSDANGFPCLRYRCSDFGISVPDEAYTIWTAGSVYCKGYFSNANIYVNSTGYFYLYPSMNVTTSNDEVSMVFNPCIYIWKSFGDSPNV